MKFKFVGGIREASQDHTEKFLLFLVNGGEELAFYEAKKYGLIRNVLEGTRPVPDQYESDIIYAKLFCFQHRYRGSQQLYSFYFRYDEEGPIVTLKGFGFGAGGFIFESKGTLLKKTDALDLVKDITSREFIRRQSPLPKMVRKQMVQIRYEQREVAKVRTIRI